MLLRRKNTWVLMVLLLVAFVGILAGYLFLQTLTADNRAPVIEVTDTELAISVSDPQNALLQGITATDNRDGDVTNLMVVESIYGISADHHVTVTYAAFDYAGNVAKLERQVKLSDYKPPRFTLNGALAFEDGSNFDIMSMVGAQDLRDGDLRHKLKATSMSTVGSITEPGIHDIQFRVTNSLGDTQHLMLPLEIYAKDRYNADLLLSDYLIYLPVGSSFNPRNYMEAFEIYGEAVSLSEVDIRVNSQVNMSQAGVYTVSYTGTYTEDNRSYRAYTKLIVVVEG